VIPSDLLTMCLTHSDPVVRMYGAERAGRMAQLKLVSQGRIQFPPVGDLVRKLAESDPDPGVKRRASDVVSYMEAFNIK
jgi:hypothetical protein